MRDPKFQNFQIFFNFRYGPWKRNKYCKISLFRTSRLSVENWEKHPLSELIGQTLAQSYADHARFPPSHLRSSITPSWGRALTFRPAILYLTSRCPSTLSLVRRLLLVWRWDSGVAAAPLSAADLRLLFSFIADLDDGVSSVRMTPRVILSLPLSRGRHLLSLGLAAGHFPLTFRRRSFPIGWGSVYRRLGNSIEAVAKLTATISRLLAGQPRHQQQLLLYIIQQQQQPLIALHYMY